MTNLNYKLPKRLELLLDNNGQDLISGGLKGIEKESLRISADGVIAHTAHPKALGAALTHPHITTDYSEALLEFITPPFADTKDTLDYLNNIHQYVYDQVKGEMLLAASMPCGIDGDESVPIAEYGTSNIGKMKHIYRTGLWHRYGRTMQAIAGIHYNYSLPTALLKKLHKLEKSPLSLEDYTAAAYFDLIRNIQRQGWLILYLFGASPAICKKFFKSRPHLMDQFEEFDQYTLYHPYATSLRMSDIGYKSKNQANLHIDYNSLSGYVESLSQAISTPFPDYEKIGVKVDGQYRQLNSNLLQIENEFYSIVRPKQIAFSGEKPTLALKRRGVRYIELRSLDLDLFSPIGIKPETAYFVEAFLITCFFQKSPPLSQEDHRTNNQNQLKVANHGRKRGLELEQDGEEMPLDDWADQIFAAMEPICQLLDADQKASPYRDALKKMQETVQDQELTPSAKILEQMTDHKEAFACFAIRASAEHEKHFRKHHLDPKLTHTFNEMASQSLAKQRELEQKDQIPFDDFLAHYFAQK
ncbi:glutamate--cysteine ligase [Methylicorpusculum oleiharenae]|uniref:glutamate--cysteine ligase n=1 Tax=Methylicorpusculum oleiharenae TaxID=1338687 RepID=UPI00135903BB|nr:glutamate--cysteine ligase [Methylicorpusculum oleiharenae]MCD2448998.1 glutamate--cysteine ligase [Methylicorpusculum oleiharenae]